MIVDALIVFVVTSGKPDPAPTRPVAEAVHTPAVTVPTGHCCRAVSPVAAERMVTVPETGAPASMPELPTIPVSCTATWNSPRTLAPVRPFVPALPAARPPLDTMVGGAMSTPKLTGAPAACAPAASNGWKQTVPAAGTA